MERTEAPTAARDGLGRWMPGQSGNPAGKRPGTKHRAALLRETLSEGEIGMAAHATAEAADETAAAARVAARPAATRPRAATGVKAPPSPAFSLHLQAQERAAAPPPGLTAALRASTAPTRAAI